MGVVTCVYVNPETEQFWIIDYRIFSPETDGRTKLDHAEEMLQNAHLAKELTFKTVLMDTWYATVSLLKQIEGYGKTYYCPVKENRLVSYLDAETGKPTPYQQVSTLTWSEEELTMGRKVHLRGMTKGHTVTVFRLVVSTNRTDYVITNDGSTPNIEETKQVCGLRWKIEQFHRELKQLSGLASCQC
ncbi:MAG TPA: transposase [Rhodothermales bacterium]|nr:transposase [Rhodothermales bacterium]